MGFLILLIFCAALLTCIILNASILYALAFGLMLFFLYGRHKGFSWRELIRTALEGVAAVRNILITFLLIGMLTALWRAAGTIPFLVSGASYLIRPSVFLLMAFLLNSGVSYLTGTSFGTAATMGVICAAMGSSLQISPLLTGGAVLSGVFFGDRCSPVSTSALLVATLTKTDIFGNIRRMLRSAFIPFLLACFLYGVIGARIAGSGEIPDLRSIFGQQFVLHWIALAPAVVILLLSILHVNVKLAMAASIAAAVQVCLFLQHAAPADLLKMMITGFHSDDAGISALLDGGGILSMVRVAGIVCLSSSYSGILRKTGLLDQEKRIIDAVSEKTSIYAGTFFTSVAASMISCNQTLSIMLTSQLRGSETYQGSDLAIDLEDSAVVVAPLIPWSIAGSVPLASVGAPVSSVLFAFYLYLIPVWRLSRSFFGKKKIDVE